MKTRLRKELRELRPFILAAAALVVTLIAPLASSIESHPLNSRLAYLLMPFVLGPLSVRPFTAEFERETLELLLAQPITRGQIWAEKLIASSVGSALVLLLFGLFTVASSSADATRSLGWSWFLLTGATSVFGGALWALLLRSTLVACVATVLAPFALAVGSLSLLDSWLSIGWGGMGWIYVAVCLIFSRRAFSRLEPTAAGSTKFEWKHPSSDASSLPAAQRRTHGPLWHLIRKELRVQSVNLRLLGGLACLAVLFGGLSRLPLIGVEQFHGLALVLLGFLFLGPLLLGAQATAGEHAWGVEAWQASLPSSRRIQWFAKLCVSAVLALSMIATIVAVSTSIIGPIDIGLRLSRLTGWFPIASLSFVVGFWASSRCRDSLTAIVLAAVLCGAGGMSRFFWESGWIHWNAVPLKTLTEPFVPKVSLGVWGLVTTVVLLTMSYKDFRPSEWRGSSVRRWEWLVLSALIVSLAAALP